MTSTTVTTVRDVCWDTLRGLGITRLFANPGSTEVPLLVGMPDDFDFVLGLHESSVVGMATGAAMATGDIALALLHTTAGLGNAIGALATARENRVPLVVLVGQQDRRHLVNTPFLTGELEGLGGRYPVWVATPPRPEDLPDLIARAANEAIIHRGPAFVIVPMGDWEVPMPQRGRSASPLEIETSSVASDEVTARVAAMIAAAENPVIVSGAGSATPAAWEALRRLATHSNIPVWQEPFGAAPGYPPTDSHYRGILSAGRAQLRAQLTEHDFVLVVGAHAIRQYGYESGPLFDPGTRVVVLTDDPAKAIGSTADLAVLASIAQSLDAIVAQLPQTAAEHDQLAAAAERQMPGGKVIADRLTPEAVFAALDAVAPRDVVVFEETPSTRLALSEYFPARNPHGYISAAMGGLGFAMPAAVGYRMAVNDRPVVAVIGDGSAMYSIQSLWSAQRYGIGVLFVVLVNGGYAIMDQLARLAGGDGPWPSFPELSFPQLAEGLGCESIVVSSPQEMVAAASELVGGLRTSREPVVLVVQLDQDQAVETAQRKE